MATTGTRHIVEAVISCWESSALDAAFRALRADPADVRDVLHERDAEPLTPRPYCVWEQGQGNRAQHNTFDNTNARQIRNTFFRFTVHGQTKQIAADLADRIMEVFDNAEICPSNGKVISVKYQNDFHVRLGDDEWSWMVDYEILFDALTNP